METSKIRQVGEILQSDIHENAVEKGFWNIPNDGEKIALIHAEVSELLEALRDPDWEWKNSSHEGLELLAYEEEAADIAIRLFDFAQYKGFNLLTAVLIKHAYNKTREHRHGKNF